MRRAGQPDRSGRTTRGRIPSGDPTRSSRVKSCLSVAGQDGPRSAAPGYAAGGGAEERPVAHMVNRSRRRWTLVIDELYLIGQWDSD